ncbi:acyl-CoA dehydrogenase [Nocardioides limicola]|uniref:acyl-CoA dehydrogenase n=1 Tax=Nocardioides limicola TaxID=2803368 RepID=UPI00193AE068|nr:acyl-CoA dehydrogenase [Nocardioides sp. DJM-14]
MSIGLNDDHRSLAESVRGWAESVKGPALAREAEGDADATFAPVWSELTEMGIPLISVPEEHGGGGGTVLDLAVALEACAHHLVPGRLWGTAVAAALLGGRQVPVHGLAVGVGLTPSLRRDDEGLTGTVEVVIDAVGADAFLVASTDDGEAHWWWVPAADVQVTGHAGLDLTRRTGQVRVSSQRPQPVQVTTDEVLAMTITLAAAEAAGLARRCVQVAVEYAGVREQFGAPIGRFQAIKHLCAQMLETAEAVTAAAWDAASAWDQGDDATQRRFATEVAATVATDGAVAVAQDCIQVLGGIGFTFEHDAHLYLRRATALRALLGSGDRHAARLAELAVSGVRRSIAVDLAGRDAEIRPQVREQVASIAALPAAERRAALAEAGFLAPHWPVPHGLAADAVHQLVIDEELAAAGVVLPDLKIGAWAVPTLIEHGSAAQQQRFVQQTLQGTLSWCQLFSEPGAGSDLASLRTRAERVDGGWRLTGQKVWTSLAREADWGICLARTDPEVAKHRGITYFLVDMRSPGLDIRPLREMTGDAMFNEVFLDSVFVPDDCVVGEVNGGWALARTTLANERVAMATSRLGASTEEAVSLVAAGSDPVDLARVGHQVALATVCALLATRTTLRSLTGQGPGAESSVAKLLGVRNRQQASELVVDLLGAAAVTGSDQIATATHEMLLTRCLSIAGGTTQVLRNVIAERILRLPR